MDQSYSESDLSLSPSQILERLQVLRQLQMLQRGKLQKQQLQYHNETPESPSISQIISHFSSSTSYNTFKTLLQFSSEQTCDDPIPDISNISSKIKQKDLMEGVTVLNLSQESEFIVCSPISSNRTEVSKSDDRSTQKIKSIVGLSTKKNIELDEMPILTPKKDFESLLLEKLKNDNTNICNIQSNKNKAVTAKKTFLKKGQGMTRFGLHRNDLVIQNTNTLPWRRRNNHSSLSTSISNSCAKKVEEQFESKTNKKQQIQASIPDTKQTSIKQQDKRTEHQEACNLFNEKSKINKDSGPVEPLMKKIETEVKKPPLKTHPLRANRGKTWAAILTKEQDDFLKQLKQTEYYKNFTSPAKSTASDLSCDDDLNHMMLQKEKADQNMFDLLEKKVNQSNYNLENSFFYKFLRKSQLECSGESTPLILQKCLSDNPGLLHILPPPSERKQMYNETASEVECDSEYTDCDHETCSTVSTCSSCKTVEEKDDTLKHVTESENQKQCEDNNGKSSKLSKKDTAKVKGRETLENIEHNNDLKENMTVMNEKLVATSELLKERLNDLEDEIAVFKKENASLAKMREEIDAERHKFYEEKSAFEQKYNEDKILSEYYLAEERDKLAKQKQTYDRYVREMRGRLNKKERDEVVSLKKEISDLKEEIRIKDAKSTSTIAKLRNQIKTLEKDKNELDSENDKLKKENNRIKHTNETNKRMSNMKYLEEINRKLTTLSSRDSKSEADVEKEIRYKATMIDRQSRSYKSQNQNTRRKRAKSVPNLNVTSRYAKYFSQRDAVSQMESDNQLYVERNSPYEELEKDEINLEDYRRTDNLGLNPPLSDSEDEENNLERIYTERFKSISPDTSCRLSNSNHTENSFPSQSKDVRNTDGYFITKSQASIKSGNVSSRSLSPYLNTQSNESNRSKSPAVSILSNRSSNNRRSPVCVQVDVHRPDTVSSNPDAIKTNLNPTEIVAPDGTREIRFQNGNVKYLSADGKYCKFVYYNGDVKETFLNEGRIKYFFAKTKTYHTTHADGLEVLEFPDGQIEKHYKDGSKEIRLPNGSVRYSDPKNVHVREEWRFPDGNVLTVAASGEQVVRFTNGQVEVHTKDHKRREFPDGTVKLVYTDGTSETRYASGRIRIKDRNGQLILDSAPS